MIKDKLTVRDLPVSFEVIVTYVVGTYGFFFLFRNAYPIISMVVSSLILLDYAKFSVLDLLSEREHHQDELCQGATSERSFLTPRLWKVLAFQVLFALVFLVPPLIITLSIGNLQNQSGRAPIRKPL